MWRPELSPKETKEIVRESEKIFLKEVEKSLSDLTDDELKDKSIENYRKIIEENKIKGPFVMFLQAFNRHFKESEAQKEKRIIANYIRHNLTSYDKIISKVTDEYWVPNFFFNDLWKSSAKAISKYYPHLSGVLSEGMRAKRYYESFKDGNLETEFKNEEEFYKFISIYEEIEDEQNELIAKEEEEYRLKVEKEFSKDVFLKKLRNSFDDFEIIDVGDRPDLRYVCFTLSNGAEIIAHRALFWNESDWSIFYLKEFEQPDFLKRAEDTYGDCSDEYFKLIDDFHGEVKMNPERNWFIDFEIREPRLDRYSFDEIIYSGEFVSQSFSVDELNRVENVDKFLVDFTETVENEMKEDTEKFVKNLQKNEK